MAQQLTIERAMLVYQNGIANIFAVDSFNLSDYGRNARRIYQGSFLVAEDIAKGLGMAGATVRTVGCNMAGDIRHARWTDDLNGLPFSALFRPIYYEHGQNLRLVPGSVYCPTPDDTEED